MTQEEKLKFFYDNVPLSEVKGIKQPYIKINRNVMAQLLYPVNILQNLTGIKRGDTGYATINGMTGYSYFTFYVSKSCYNHLILTSEGMTLSQCDFSKKHNEIFSYDYTYQEINEYIQKRADNK